MHAKKSLGQHFLKSPKALALIVEAGNIGENETIFEIGPGEGVLTGELLTRAKRVVAVEKDKELIKLLEEKFKKEIAEKKLKLIEGDVLDFEPESFFSGKNGAYKIIANIPYYITGEILRKFLGSPCQPEQVVLLVQKEVAERIVARNHKESVLSISIKSYGTPTIIGKVPRGAFSPAPTVDSAIISIVDISKKFFDPFPEERFFEILKAGFAHKRKYVSRNLEKIAEAQAIQKTFEKLDISLRTRAEDLSLSLWRELAKQLS